MGNVTIRGGKGEPDQVIAFTDSGGLALASSIAADVNAHPGINVKVYKNGGSQVPAASFGAIVADGKIPVTIQAAAGTKSQSVVAGAGGVRYTATTGEALWVAGAGADTIYAGVSTVAGNTLFAAGKGDRIFLGAGAATVMETGTNAAIKGAGGAAVITDSGANNTVTGGAGAETIFGGRQGTYDLGAGAALVVNTVKGGTETVRAHPNATETVLGGTADIIFAGNSTLTYIGEGAGAATISGTGADTLIGGANNSSVLFSGSGNAALVAGVGNQTLTGAAATGNLNLFGGAGNEVLVGGSGNDVLETGSGFETLSGGAGTNLFGFANQGTTARAVVVTDFNTSDDLIQLQGFSPNASQTVLASQTTAGGVTSVMLPDGTSVQFLGAPVLSASNFI